MMAEKTLCVCNLTGEEIRLLKQDDRGDITGYIRENMSAQFVLSTEEPIKKFGTEAKLVVQATDGECSQLKELEGLSWRQYCPIESIEIDLSLLPSGSDKMVIIIVTKDVAEYIWRTRLAGEANRKRATPTVVMAVNNSDGKRVMDENGKVIGYLELLEYGELYLVDQWSCGDV